MPNDELGRPAVLLFPISERRKTRCRGAIEIHQYDGFEIEAFASMDGRQPDGVVLGREDDRLGFVSLVRDLTIEPSREREERSPALRGDLREAIEIAEPCAGARHCGDEAVQVEETHDFSGRFAG